MARIEGSSGGGGSSSLKDIIRDKVLNGGYTPICSFSAYQSRVTINEGGMVADTTNHRVYLYVDFTSNANVGSASDYTSMILFDNISTNYYPVYDTSSRTNNMPLITDESSANPKRQFYFGYNTSSYSNRIVLSYGSGTNAVKTNDHYILYATYTYK